MKEYKKSDIRHIPLLAAQIWYQADKFELPKQTKNLASYNPLFIYEKGKGTTTYYQPHPRLAEVWNRLMGQEDPHLKEIDQLYPELLAVEEEWLHAGIDMVIVTMKPGQQALLVGHNPMIDLWRSTVDPSFPRLTQALGKGEIYVVSFTDDNRFIELEHLKLPA